MAEINNVEDYEANDESKKWRREIPAASLNQASHDMGRLLSEREIPPDADVTLLESNEPGAKVTIQISRRPMRRADLPKPPKRR